jgi:hypothetical protein
VDHVKLPISDHDVLSPSKGEISVKAGNFQPFLLGILSPFLTLLHSSSLIPLMQSPELRILGNERYGAPIQILAQHAVPSLGELDLPLIFAGQAFRQIQSGSPQQLLPVGIQP